MALAVLLGAKQYDAADFVRQKVEDITGELITDDALASYAEIANEEFSRHIPLDKLVGDSVAMTSPLTTVNGQQRYVLSSANGFASVPIFVQAVTYYAAGSGIGGELTAQNEWTFIQMLYGAYRIDVQESIDSPTLRVIRNEQLDELRRYNRGYFSLVTDMATGLPAIDLLPIPTTSGSPIIVRYQGEHELTTDTDGNLIVATIPVTRVRDWAKLLLLEVLDQESDRMMKQKSMKAGLIEILQDTKTMEQRINRIREEVSLSLGVGIGVGGVSN